MASYSAASVISATNSSLQFLFVYQARGASRDKQSHQVRHLVDVGLAPVRHPAADEPDHSRGDIRFGQVSRILLERAEVFGQGGNDMPSDELVGFIDETGFYAVDKEYAYLDPVLHDEFERVSRHRESQRVFACGQRLAQDRIELRDEFVSDGLGELEDIMVVPLLFL